MINPNALNTLYGRVIKISRCKFNNSLNIQVLLESGHLVEELGFIFHSTLKLGDLVQATIGFSIVSDRYGVKAIKRVNKTNKKYQRIEYRVNRQGYYTSNKSNLKAV